MNGNGGVNGADTGSVVDIGVVGGREGGRVLGEVVDENSREASQQGDAGGAPPAEPAQAATPEQQTEPEPEPQPTPRHPISLRIIFVSEHPHAADPTCIVSDIHYAHAPSSLARVRTDTRHVLLQHGVALSEQMQARGKLLVTSGTEAPGVQGGGGRVVLFRPVLWECVGEGNDGDHVFEERIAEAARMGDWLVFLVSFEGPAAILPAADGGGRSTRGAADVSITSARGAESVPPQGVDGERNAAGANDGVQDRAATAPPSVVSERPASCTQSADAAAADQHVGSVSVHGEGSVGSGGRAPPAEDNVDETGVPGIVVMSPPPSGSRAASVRRHSPAPSRVPSRPLSRLSSRPPSVAGGVVGAVDPAPMSSRAASVNAEALPHEPPYGSVHESVPGSVHDSHHE